MEEEKQGALSLQKNCTEFRHNMRLMMIQLAVYVNLLTNGGTAASIIAIAIDANGVTACRCVGGCGGSSGGELIGIWRMNPHPVVFSPCSRK